MKKIPFLTITGTEIRYISKEELYDNSVISCEITNGTLLEPTADMKSVDLANTLFDPMMGPYKEGGRCTKCDSYGTDCPTHPGKILFKRKDSSGNLIEAPIYNTRGKFLAELVKCLNCICASCGRLKIPPEIALKAGYFNYAGLNRLTYYSEQSLKVTVCQRDVGCEKPKQYKVSKKDKDLIVRVDKKTSKNPGKAETPVYPFEAYTILKNLAPDEVRALGYTTVHPKDVYILFGVVVMPPLSRAPKTINGKTSVDDLTDRYSEIVKASNDLREANIKPSSMKIIKLQGERAQTIESDFHATSAKLRDKTKALVKETSTSGVTKVRKTFSTVISGKNGNVRRTLAGRDVDFCARSVLGPGGNLDVEEVAVPEEIANNVPYREFAFDINLPSLQKSLEKGDVLSIVRDGEHIIINAVSRKEEIIRVGDEVFRKLRDGDIVVGNRNPSLHMQSMIGHRVKIIKSSVIKIPLVTTTPLGADFDGDEYNLHIPQTIEARADILGMTLPGILESQGRGGPLIGLVYNALPGLFYLTGPTTYVSKNIFSDVVMSLGDMPNYLIRKPIKSDFTSNKEYKQALLTNYFWRAKKNNVSPYKGRSIIGLLLPGDFNYYDKIDPPYNYFMGKNKFVQHERIEVDEKGEVIKILGLYRIFDDGRRKSVETKIENSWAGPVYKVDQMKKFPETIVYLPDGTRERSFTGVQYEVQDEFVIKNGLLIKGYLSKASVGVGGSVRFLTFIYRYLGGKMGTRFLNNLDVLGNMFLSHRAHTMSLLDFYNYTDIDSTKEQISKLITEASLKVAAEGGPTGDVLTEGKRQANIINALNVIQDAGLSLMKSADSPFPGSSFQVSVDSGAKGSTLNLGQASVAIGPQLIAGALIEPKLRGRKGNRISPYVNPGVTNLSSLGFCSSPLAKGQKVSEMFTASINARFDTSKGKLSVAESGYIQRRLAQLMADLVVLNDGTVRDGKDPTSRIVMESYGGIGFTATTTYKVKDAQGIFYSPVNMTQILLNIDEDD